MELQGKVIAVLPERSGVSARGEWKSQSFVIETQETYPKQMVFDVFGADRLASYNINIGDFINVFFDITAHEYNGRWFNNIRAWNVVHIDPNTANAQPGAPISAPVSSNNNSTSTATPFPPAQESTTEGGSTDDLPF